MKTDFNTIMHWQINGTTVRIDYEDNTYFAIGRDDIFRGVLSELTLDKLYNNLVEAMKMMAKHNASKGSGDI